MLHTGMRSIDSLPIHHCASPGGGAASVDGAAADVAAAAEAVAAAPAGLLTIKMTESPRKNILDTYRSLLIAVPRVRPFPPLDASVHISFTSSRSL